MHIEARNTAFCNKVLHKLRFRHSAVFAFNKLATNAVRGSHREYFDLSSRLLSRQSGVNICKVMLRNLGLLNHDAFLTMHSSQGTCALNAADKAERGFDVVARNLAAAICHNTHLLIFSDEDTVNSLPLLQGECRKQSCLLLAELE